MNESVLYVEDEPDDVFFMERAFKKIAPEITLKVITNGQVAFNFFTASPAYPLSLVLLDLNLPGRSGLNVLSQIRKNPLFQTVPVIILSASSQESDVASAYRCGCNSYVIKPGDPEELNGLVTLIYNFWIKTNHYPEGSGGNPARTSEW